METTIGSRLMALRERAGLSLAELARLSGYRGASSIQKLFRPEYNPESLDARVGERLADALIGKGDPKIERSDIAALTDKSTTLDHLMADLRHYTYVASAFIGIHRTKKLKDTVATEGGVEIPLFIREDMSDGIPVHPCPSYLRSRGVVGLYVTVSNMWPRFEEGEPIFYEHQRPPVRGDDVIVNLISEEDLDGGAIIGRLRLLHDEEVQIDILSPADRVIIPRQSVISIRRILHPSDFLEPVAYAKQG
jgi:transcriptional regulator with XRE-family HTH domain